MSSQNTANQTPNTASFLETVTDFFSNISPEIALSGAGGLLLLLLIFAAFRRGKRSPETGSKAAPFGQRLGKGIAKSSNWFGGGLRDLLGGTRQIDAALLEEIETQLLTSDVGVDATRSVIEGLSARLTRKQLTDTDAVWRALQEELMQIIAPCELPLNIDETKQPFVILVVGVNGAGKTTTIGKLALRYKNEGKKVVLAAGDTFRAAAVEQLKTWGERNSVPVISQGTGADTASVIFDALDAARARGADLVIADTAGRLHTADNLMDELSKIRRVIAKFDETAPHETLLVLDGTTGQNAVQQAQQFTESVAVSGLAITKLDGTAKGGVLFAIAKKLGLPIRFIGVGESAEDLGVFSAEPFVKTLLGRATEEAN